MISLTQTPTNTKLYTSVSLRTLAYLRNFQAALGPNRFDAACVLLNVDPGNLSASEADRLLKILNFTLQGGDVS